MAAATAASVAAARVLGIHAASKDWTLPGARGGEARGFGHTWDYPSDARELVLPADACPVPGASEDFALDRNLGCVGLVVPRVGAFDGTVKVSARI